MLVIITISLQIVIIPDETFVMIVIEKVEEDTELEKMEHIKVP